MRENWCRIALLLLTAGCLHAAGESELRDESGKTIIRYVIEVPPGIAPAGTTDPARQVGLFLCFPEHDHPTGDEILPVRESLRRLGLSGGYILLAGHPQAQKFGIADHEPIEKLIAWAKSNYPINPRRVYMYGKGEGGKISAEFGMAHPSLVTAGIAYSWGWWLMPSELNEPLDALNSAPEFYLVLGLRDLATHIATVRDTYGRVNAKGYHLIYREFDDLGARTYHPASNDDAIAWATRLRNKNLPLEPGEVNLLKAFEKPAPRVSGDGYFDGIALVGGAQAGTAVRKLLKSGDPATRAAAAETCSHGIFSEETIADLSAGLTDTEPRVRRAVIGALALNAQWRSQTAQKLLIEFVSSPDRAFLDRTSDASDRISAVDALGQAVKFQVKGVRQDPPVFAELIALLTDKNEDVRNMAANILAPIRDPDFRGDSGRPEKKAPDGGWQQWLNEITAKEAGYREDYNVCRGSSLAPAVELFCTGGTYLLGYDTRTGQVVRRQPALAFRKTMEAAEQGYIPAEAALGMMYANGQGTQQNYAEAGRWWSKAAAGGHSLAAANAARVPKAPGPPANTAPVTKQ